MKRLNLIIALALLVTSCNNGIKQSDYDALQTRCGALQKELSECKNTIDELQNTINELQNTPQARLIRGRQAYMENDFVIAKKEFNDLIEKFNGSDEAIKAKLLVDEIENQERKKREAEERKKTQGFKVLKENSSVTVGDVTVKFNSVKTGNRWISDDYGYEYLYRSAERGEIYLLANVSISSESKNPDLPPIAVYTMSDGTLSLEGTMRYEFYKWRDYGAYLGNYTDDGNNFSHTKTIRFSCGISLSKTDMSNKTIFVVVKKVNCFYRKDVRHANPPVSYTQYKEDYSTDCDLKQTLTVDDFDNDYVLIKVFNRNKL
jgi:hypothetical protein